VSGPLSPTPVICVSHGFQTNYERGFCNGLAACGVAVTLISSDRSDTAGLLHPQALDALRQLPQRDDDPPSVAELLHTVQRITTARASF